MLRTVSMFTFVLVVPFSATAQAPRLVVPDDSSFATKPLLLPNAHSLHLTFSATSRDSVGKRSDVVGKAMLIGATIGAVAGAVGGAFIKTGCAAGSSSACGNSHGAIVGYGLLGGFAGAVAGALVGKALSFGPDK